MVDSVIMPEQVSLGFSGGPNFSTDVLTQAGGQERRLQNRALAVHAYSFSYDDQPAAIVTAARAFFYDRRGSFKSFLFKDWTDYGVVASLIGTGDGAEDEFQITKTYTGGANPYVRTIRHIKSGTLSVYLNGVLQTLTTHYTVNATGLVDFVTPPGVAVLVTATLEFYVPVRFEGDGFNAVLPYRTLETMSVADLAVVEVLP